MNTEPKTAPEVPMGIGSINEPPGSQVIPPTEPDPKTGKLQVPEASEENDDTDLSDPDEMEEEIDEAVEEGNAKKINHRTPPSKRKR